MLCPRRSENPGPFVLSESDEFLRGACSYCGGLDPGEFMARLEAGDVTLIPTDKDYKVYVQGDEWKPPRHAKFYFQHLSEDQRSRFVELLNGKKLKIDYPGHFYRLPFFVVVVK